MKRYILLGLSAAIFSSCSSFKSSRQISSIHKGGSSLEESLLEIQNFTSSNNLGPSVWHQLDFSWKYRFIERNVNDKSSPETVVEFKSKENVLKVFKFNQSYVNNLDYRWRIIENRNRGELVILAGQPGEVYIFSPEKNKKVSCIVDNGIHHDRFLLRVKDKILHYTTKDYSDEKPSILISEILINDDSCSSTKVKEIEFEKGLREFRVASLRNGTSIILADRTERNYTGTDFIELLKFDKDLNVIDRFQIKTHKLRLNSGLYFPSVSYSNDGLLFSGSPNDSLMERNIYKLSSDEKLVLVAKSADFAFWLNSEEIIVGRNRFAGFHDLQLVSKRGDLISKFNLSMGEKTNVFFDKEKNTITFNNNQRSGGYIQYELSLSTHKVKIIDDSFSYKNQFRLAKLPTSKMVNYTSSGRRLNGFLHLPSEVCKEGDKLPAVVYIHGGSYHNLPISDGLHVRSDNDFFMLNQIGAVVFEANITGDHFSDSSYYTKNKNWYLQKDGIKEQLEDIHEAGNFIRNLPCVDEKKIVLYGHSWGATYSSLYLTERRFSSDSPYTNAVLRGGSYRIESGISEFSSPRIAVRDTEFEKTLPMNAYEVENGKIKVFRPTQKIYHVDEALEVLNKLSSDGQEYYGVEYYLPESFYYKINPIKRAKYVAQIPIVIMSGQIENQNTENGLTDYLDARMLENELKKYSTNITTWYPDVSQHGFTGKTQIEMVYRFIEILSR